MDGPSKSDDKHFGVGTQLAGDEHHGTWHCEELTEGGDGADGGDGAVDGTGHCVGGVDDGAAPEPRLRHDLGSQDGQAVPTRVSGGSVSFVTVRDRKGKGKVMVPQDHHGASGPWDLGDGDDGDGGTATQPPPPPPPPPPPVGVVVPPRSKESRRRQTKQFTHQLDRDPFVGYPIKPGDGADGGGGGGGGDGGDAGSVTHSDHGDHDELSDSAQQLAQYLDVDRLLTPEQPMLQKPKSLAKTMPKTRPKRTAPVFEPPEEPPAPWRPWHGKWHRQQKPVEQVSLSKIKDNKNTIIWSPGWGFVNRRRTPGGSPPPEDL